MAANDFVLDFKFGGNAEFLARLETLMRRVDSMFESTSEDIKEATSATNDLNKAARNATPGIEKMSGGLTRLAGALKSVVAGYVGLQGISKMWSFGNGSIELFKEQARQERQLQTVLKNKGLGNEFEGIKEYAAQIQSRTTYGDEAMIGAAGELATYVKSSGSMKRMMDLLADYAAGMTGGGEVSPQQMVDLATGLGKAFDGSYEAMRKKGFDTSELEMLKRADEIREKYAKGETFKLSADDKEAIKFFNDQAKKGMSLEDMKISALENAMSDWKGLAEVFADSDAGRITQIKNTIGDMREELGKRLLPVIANIMKRVQENLPKIQLMMDALGNAFMALGNILTDNLDELMEVGEILGKAISFVSEFPTLSAIAVMSLMALKSGFLGAADGVSGFQKQLETSNAELLKMNKNAAMLIGGAGMAAGMSAFGTDKNEADNAVGGLKAMGLAAAFGASQFGLMGAAIGAAGVALGGLIKWLYELYKTSKETGAVKEEIEARDRDMQTLLRYRKDMKNGVAGGSVNYMRALSEFEAKWGSLDGSFLTEGMDGRAAAGKAVNEAVKKQINVKVNSENTITQNVTMETSLAEASVVMRTNLREFIQDQLKIDAKSVGAVMAI